MTIDFTYGSFNTSAVDGLQVTDVDRPLVGANRDIVTWVPGREEPVVFPQPRGQRLITVACFVKGADYTERRAIINEVTAGLEAETEVVSLVLGDEPDVTWQARLDDCDEPDEVANTATLTITFNVFGRVEAS